MVFPSSDPPGRGGETGSTRAPTGDLSVLRPAARERVAPHDLLDHGAEPALADPGPDRHADQRRQIEEAWGREEGKIPVVAVSLKKKKKNRVRMCLMLDRRQRTTM